MAQNKLPNTERITSSFKRLAAASSDLNIAADELGGTIATLNKALKHLNLGVSAWHEIAGHEDEDGGAYWTRDIGYTQIDDDWVIALRKTWGHNGYDHHGEQVWAFNDAPRWMCVESIAKLPDLFDDLVGRTEDTTQKIKAKTAEARELAAAINAVAVEVGPKRK